MFFLQLVSKNKTDKRKSSQEARTNRNTWNKHEKKNDARRKNKRLNTEERRVKRKLLFHPKKDDRKFWICLAKNRYGDEEKKE